MSQLIAEVEICKSGMTESKPLRTDAGSMLTLTCKNNGSCTLECSTDGGQTWYERFAVNMGNMNASANLSGEGMFMTVISDVDYIRVTNVTGYDKIIASIS